MQRHPLLPDQLSYGTDAWLADGGRRLSIGGGREILLEPTSVQGIPGLATPSWALEVPGLDEPAWASALQQQAPIVVVDFPASFDDRDLLADWATRGWALSARHTRWLPLTPSFTADDLPKQRRKQRRRAEAQPWQMETRMGLGEFATLHQAARVRKKIAGDQTKLIGLLNRLSSNNLLTTSGVRRKDGVPLAACGFVPHGDRIVYAFGGAAEHTQDSAAAVVCLLTEGILAAAAAGFSTFDFGGSMDPGVDGFYREFGGVQVPKWRAVHVAPWAKPWIWLRRPELLRGSGTFAT